VRRIRRKEAVKNQNKIIASCRLRSREWSDFFSGDVSLVTYNIRSSRLFLLRATYPCSQNCVEVFLQYLETLSLQLFPYAVTVTHCIYNSVRLEFYH
jgi:hypothetical protein